MKFLRLNPFWIGLGILIIVPFIIVAYNGLRRQQPNAQPQAIPVVITTQPIRQDLIRTIELPGDFKAYQQAVLYAKMPGYLETIRVDKGDQVQQGQLIAQLTSPELFRAAQEARGNYQSALSELNLSKTMVQKAASEKQMAQAEAELQKQTYARYSAIQEADPALIAGQEVDIAKSKYLTAASQVNAHTANIESAKAAQMAASSRVYSSQASLGQAQSLAQYTRIAAPFSGIITARHVDPGAFITSGEAAPIVTLMNLDRLRLQVAVPEKDTRFIQKGNSVQIMVDALPNQVFTGTITRFASALDPATRTMLTEIELPNPHHQILPGMVAKARLNLEKHPRAFTLPEEAVVHSKKGDFVWIVNHGRTKKISIETGINDGVTVEIVKGLQRTEQVIAQNQKDLTEDQPVKTMVE